MTTMKVTHTMTPEEVAAWAADPLSRFRTTPGLVHGTLTGYDYYHCHCVDCRRAARDRVRAYRARKRARS